MYDGFVVILIMIDEKIKKKNYNDFINEIKYVEKDFYEFVVILILNNVLEIYFYLLK